MKAIKRQFIDFFNYTRLYRCGINTTNLNKQKIGRTIFGFILYILVLFFILSQTSNSINYIYGGMIGGVIGVCVISLSKPSAISVAPFSPKQRVVFNFLGSALIGIIMSLYITAIMIILLLFMALFVFLITGENVFVFENTPSVAYPAYGEAYAVLLSLFVYFALYAICYMSTKRAKIISGVALLIGLEIFSLIIINLCGKYEYSFYSFQIYSDVPMNITRLAYPWIPILILSVFTALAIAATIFNVIRQFKSDKV